MGELRLLKGGRGQFDEDRILLTYVGDSKEDELIFDKYGLNYLLSSDAYFDQRQLWKIELPEDWSTRNIPGSDGADRHTLLIDQTGTARLRITPQGVEDCGPELPPPPTIWRRFFAWWGEKLRNPGQSV